MPIRCLSIAVLRIAPSVLLVAVTMIVDKAFRRTGVARPSPGAAHLLRHSLATALLWKGSSLEDIAAILRHCSMETTQIYAKVDIPAFQKIAPPCPHPHPR